MSCPSAESIVKTTVDEALSRNPGLGSGLIRLHFHDCFVRGCDGSVLIDSIARNKAEKESPANKPSLWGFEVIDLAKARIEKACPRTVSCADIFTFAARDSVTRLGGFHYAVPAGRRDGTVSSMLEVLQNLPNPFSNVQNLKNRFGVKGLSMDEMVTLSGAHSIGVSHYTSSTRRLYPRQDTSIDPVFAAQLKATLLITTLVTVVISSASSLRTDFYNMSCPSAESIVKTTVDEALSRNPGLGSGLIRLHFHDCFVRGCDGSVLIDSTARNKAEKESPANKPSLWGFEVIDLAKARIGKVCPRTVSCANIFTFAARDSVTRLGGFHYVVPAGRRDGTVSSMLEVLQNLPNPFSNVQNLKNRFGVKGLSMDEMVTLSGAHSIGVSHYTLSTRRLYPRQDTSIDPVFAAQLKATKWVELNNRPT
ncbi:Peroxidase 5 [Acorus gramineus]|uniref:peroxidase n=1 Tax=Acorus gramineus TaxID=55184 RepID=A0AAV9BLE5_ACOGR|nr:Peroxidase 5 [Acorus gramineus]